MLQRLHALAAEVLGAAVDPNQPLMEVRTNHEHHHPSYPGPVLWVLLCHSRSECLHSAVLSLKHHQP